MLSSKTLCKMEELIPACWVGIILFLVSVFSFSASAQNTRIKWSSFSSGFGISNSTNTRITSSAGQTFIGTNTGFLVDYSLIITDIEDEKELIPIVFNLNQNYPNPFNPSTVISWQLPVSSHVSLKVYDILGREVTTLINENREAGYYKTTLDGSSLASGMYIYRLSATGGAGDFISTKKMLMIK